MSILKLLCTSFFLLNLIGCSTLPPAKALTKPEFAQADSYFLYAYALRDAKITTAENTTIRQQKNGNTTTYTFNNHTIKECGSHLTGFIKITTTRTHQVHANFPTVELNPLGINSFKFAIHEDPKNPKIAEGKAIVNGLTFDIKDIIVVSGF